MVRAAIDTPASDAVSSITRKHAEEPPALSERLPRREVLPDLKNADRNPCPQRIFGAQAPTGTG
ncbi:hypothetical protein GCM10009630_28860 [Kribbella jejuensis]